MEDFEDGLSTVTVAECYYIHNHASNNMTSAEISLHVLFILHIGSLSESSRPTVAGRTS
jgi:hypothetical protein